MIIYLKYFFLFPKVSHHYLYFFYNIFFFFKFNMNTIFSLKKVIYNYLIIFKSLLKLYKNSFLFNFIKTLPINTLLTEVQVHKLFFKKTNYNIFFKNIVNKDYSFLNFKINSVYNFIFLFNDFMYFIGKKSSISNVNTLFSNLQLNYFLLLINSNWNLIININNIFRSIRHGLISIIKIGGIRQYAIYSSIFLWKYWSNIFFVIFNISFYNTQILSFSKIFFKKIVDPFNWISWSLSFFFFKYINKFFFFRYTNKNEKALSFFKNFKTWFNGISLILDSNYHFSVLQIFNKFNIFNISLVDINHEPWLSWYPIPGRSSDLTLQYLFLILIFKIRLLGLNLFFFYKFYYIFILRLLNLLYNFKSITYILI